MDCLSTHPRHWPGVWHAHCSYPPPLSPPFTYKSILTQLQPIIAAQGFLDEPEHHIGTSFLMFGHTMGGAVFITLSQTIFLTGLRSLIPQYAPKVDPNVVIGVGSIPKGLLAVDPNYRPQVLIAICKSLNRVFYLLTGAAFMAFCFAWGIGWRTVKKQRRSCVRGSESSGLSAAEMGTVVLGGVPIRVTDH